MEWVKWMGSVSDSEGLFVEKSKAVGVEASYLKFDQLKLQTFWSFRQKYCLCLVVNFSCAPHCRWHLSFLLPVTWRIYVYFLNQLTRLKLRTPYSICLSRYTPPRNNSLYPSIHQLSNHRYGFTIRPDIGWCENGEYQKNLHFCDGPLFFCFNLDVQFNLKNHSQIITGAIPHTHFLRIIVPLKVSLHRRFV